MTVLAALALLGLACLGIWIASFWYVAVRSHQRTTAHRGSTTTRIWQIGAMPNRVEWHHSTSATTFTTTVNPMLADRPPMVLETHRGGIERLRSNARPFPPAAFRKPWPVWRHVERAGSIDHSVSVPLAWPTAAFLAPPTLALTLAWRRRRSAARVGLCRVCGFDLRASPERCPECGTPVQAAPIVE